MREWVRSRLSFFWMGSVVLDLLFPRARLNSELPASSALRTVYHLWLYWGWLPSPWTWIINWRPRLASMKPVFMATMALLSCTMTFVGLVYGFPQQTETILVRGPRLDQMYDLAIVQRKIYTTDWSERCDIPVVIVFGAISLELPLLFSTCGGHVSESDVPSGSLEFTYFPESEIVGLTTRCGPSPCPGRCLIAIWKYRPIWGLHAIRLSVDVPMSGRYATRSKYDAAIREYLSRDAIN